MNRLMKNILTNRPWYKEPWPWLLMSLPATAIVAGLATWLIAFRSDDGLVAQDYYKQGLAINRVLARQERAIQLGLSARLQQEGNTVVLSLMAGRELVPEERLLLQLLNPARAGLDQKIVLQRDGDGYSGKLEPVRDGRWNIRLEDEGGIWQLFAETTLPLDGSVVLKP